MRTGSLKLPRSSETATKVLPESTLVAVTVTPGSTAPVESVTVPVMTESCAYPGVGSATIIPNTSSDPRTLHVLMVIAPPAMGFRYDMFTADRERCTDTKWPGLYSYPGGVSTDLTRSPCNSESGDCTSSRS